MKPRRRGRDVCPVERIASWRCGECRRVSTEHQCIKLFEDGITLFLCPSCKDVALGARFVVELPPKK